MVFWGPRNDRVSYLHRWSIQAELGAALLMVGVWLYWPLAAQSSVPTGYQSLADSLNAPVDQYEVVAGDTLWEISERLLGDPTLWPRVWALNPEIENPHWIYPEQSIRFYAANLVRPSLDGLAAPTDALASTSVGPRAERSMWLRWVATPTLPSGVGKVSSAEDGRLFLAQDAEVVLELDSKVEIEAGRLLVSVRSVGAIPKPTKAIRKKMPSSMRKAKGYVMQFGAILKPVRVIAINQQRQYVQARVLRLLADAEVGDTVLPLNRNLQLKSKSADETYFSKALEGMVRAAIAPGYQMAGQGDLIFVQWRGEQAPDVGQKLRIQPSGVPGVQRSLSEQAPLVMNDRMSPNGLAEAMILDVSDPWMTCLVLKSAREVSIGDTIVDAADVQ